MNNALHLLHRELLLFSCFSFETVPGSFTGRSDFGITFVLQNPYVSLSCKAHVGDEPPAQLVWYIYYYNGSLQDISSQALVSLRVPYQTCSFTQVSTLVLTVDPSLNGARLRCMLNQTGVTITDDYRDVSCKYNKTLLISSNDCPPMLKISIPSK